MNTGWRWRKAEIMYIEGIGIIRKEEAMSILTEDGKEAVKSGDITAEELGKMYKLEQVKRLSKIGSMQDTFRASYKWIPEKLKETLSPKNIAELVDRFHDCYGAGKSEK